MNASNNRILLIDSGIGGLSIFNELTTQLPFLSIDYFCDHAFFPYGNKELSTLVTRVHDIVENCLQKHSYDLAVIACNTASTVVLPSLRSSFDIPFVGVVPAIKPACALSLTRQVGLLATEGTVTREYTHNLIKEFACDAELTLVGCAELVKEAEKKLAGKPVDLEVLKQVIAPFKAKNVDTIVLGCTHFPWLVEELASVIEWPVKWVDSGKAIAARVESLLNDQASHLLDRSAAQYRFYTSGACSDIHLDHLPMDFTLIESFQV
ncbi:glutamate racemase [Litoribacillus peritrichatus]|uniref:Glutamate racemase n=1 Tax=Litoribacillus peritrichatus TaxID=718191 RepID=A0ABP7M214_9GAMM